MKRILLSGLTLIVLICLFEISFAIDSPHAIADGVNCYKCHTLHNAPGTSLTSTNSDQNLCLSCHTSGNPLAGTKPFSAQTATSVIPGTIGNQHSWVGTMPAISSPSNAHGLRPTNNLDNADLKARLVKFNNVVTCSVCHNPHNQKAVPWDPDSPTTYTAGVTTNRHLLRGNMNLNDLCEDCHYYRAMTYTRADGEDGAYPPNGTNVFGHSTGDLLNSRGYDRTAPLDFDGVAQQTAPRYQNNSSGTDTIKTNNLVLDALGYIRCLSCHRLHYVDSNGLTPDGF